MTGANDPNGRTVVGPPRDRGAAGSSSPRPALSFEGISKAFPGVQALDCVSLDVREGEIHALVGENGAGKSTLMAVAAGVLAPDTGRVAICGSELDYASTKLAHDLGVGIAYQEPALVPDLTVAENLWLGSRSGVPPGGRQLRRWAAAVLDRWSLGREIDPTLPVRELGSDVCCMVEIAKAFEQGTKVLILDEPTEHLAAQAVEALFEKVCDLAREGTAVMYISHRIPEVRRISTRVSVLRDGTHQGTYETERVSEAEIINMIVGRPLGSAFPPKRSSATDPHAAPIAEISGLSGIGFENFGLEVAPGEIVGLAGIEGNGQREVVRTLAGLAPASGNLRVAGKRIRLGSQAIAAAGGIAYIPNDRHAEGVFPALGVRENISIGTIERHAKFGIVRPRAERQASRKRIAGLKVKTPSLDTPIGNLSGGNQQKAVLARVLGRSPKLILADEPTQGVDVGSRVEIYRFLRDAVEDDSGAIVVSSDGAELEGLCDRVIVLSRGHQVRELSGADLTERNITEAALMATTSRDLPVTRREDSRLRRFARGDLTPPVVLAIAVLALGAFTATRDSTYLTGTNFTNLLALFAAIAFVSMAQQVVMFTGGIDLSVGPLTGLLLVIGSFVVADGQSGFSLILGLGLLFLVACVVGAVNWAPTLVGIPPFLATLVTYNGLQGLSLLLRPLPGGVINQPLIKAISTRIGFVPVAAIVAVAVGLGLQIALRRTSWGVNLRAVGSAAQSAKRMGVSVRRIQFAAYVMGGVLVFFASLLLMAQVQTGDPAVGVSYTLISIAAAVLGGASIFGGRGAFLGALLGALMVQQINTSVLFLHADSAWQTYLLGGLTLAAAGFYSRARRASHGA